jgi:hypothetical protein
MTAMSAPELTGSTVSQATLRGNCMPIQPQHMPMQLLQDTQKHKKNHRIARGHKRSATLPETPLCTTKAAGT